jgi:pimeloyl-ACP methyl ester carboxylesterase
MNYKLFPQCFEFVLVLGLAATAQTATSQQQFFEAGQNKLFINCTGQRHGPAVIFESGRGRSSEDWSKVQPGIAKFTEACSYDRVGIGKSTPIAASQERSIDEKIEDLHLLLTQAGIRAPYILVGHSIGGVFVRRFTSKYPKEVAGMVLVDSVHEEQMWRVLDIDPDSLGNARMADNISKEGYLPPREPLRWHYDIPLIVLRHGIPIVWRAREQKYAVEVEAMMLRLQQDLASRSRYGELRTAEHSGHFIQIEEPDVVVQAIRDVLDSVNQKK